MTKKSKNPLRVLGLVFLTALLAIPYAVQSDYLFHLFILICVFGSLATAWNIVGGFAGQLSLGHAVFYGIGSYSAALLLARYGLSPWIGMLAGMLASAVVAVLVSWPTLRLRGPFFALASIAILEVIRLLVLHESDWTGGSSGVSLPLDIGLQWMVFREKGYSFALAYLFLCVTLLAAHGIRRSRFGFSLFAVREREDAARAVGIDVVRVRIAAAVASAMLASMIGTYYAVYLTYIDPDTTFSLALSIQMAMFALIGGLGTVLGPLVGAAVVMPVAELTRAWLGSYGNGLHGTIYGIILVAAVVLAPRGIVGSLQQWMDRRSATGPSSAGSAGSIGPDGGTSGRNGQEGMGGQRGGIPVLRAAGLRKSFGGLAATRDVSIELMRGEILGVIGPNGAGKTTLFNQLSGYIAPDEGTVQVLAGDGTWRKPRTACEFARCGVGRTFQIAQPFSGLSVLENVMLGAFMHTDDPVRARASAREILAVTDLAPHADKEARSLTIGGLKRLEIARALATRPSVLLLDEVMAGLNPADIDRAVALIRRVRDAGVSVLLIEHQMQATMALCDRIVVLDLGAVLTCGAPADVVRDERVVEAYLGKGFSHAESA